MSCNMLFSYCCAAVVAACVISDDFAQAEAPAVTFSKRCLIFDMNEGCAVADVNQDGKLDVIAGKHWYAATEYLAFT